MAGQIGARSDFAETFAIHVGLKTALKSRQYEQTPSVKRAAEQLLKSLQSDKTIYGKQLQMLSLMEKGATIAELGRKLRCSRRTAFRYLNHLEDAGIDITLEDGKYTVGKAVAKMMRA